MIEEMQKSIIVPANELILTEDRTIDDLELLAIANYLKTYKPAFRPMRRK